MHDYDCRLCKVEQFTFISVGCSIKKVVVNEIFLCVTVKKNNCFKQICICLVRLGYCGTVGCVISAEIKIMS